MNQNEKSRDSLLPPTKVVLRRLPPSFTEEDLRLCVSSLCSGHLGMPPGCEGYEVLHFKQGKLSRRRGIVPSVGYVVVRDPELAQQFISLVTSTDVFQKHEKVLAMGPPTLLHPGMPTAAPSWVVASEAPCQKLPSHLKRNPKKDERTGTYANDPLFKKFLEDLNCPIEKLPSAEVQLDQRLSSASTAAGANHREVPLVEYLIKKREMREKQRLVRKEKDEAARKALKKDQRRKNSVREKEKEKETTKKMQPKRDQPKVENVPVPPQSFSKSNKPSERNEVSGPATQTAKHAETKAPVQEKQDSRARMATAEITKQQVKILSKALGVGEGAPRQLLPKQDGAAPTQQGQVHGHGPNRPKPHSQQMYIPKAQTQTQATTGTASKSKPMDNWASKNNTPSHQSSNWGDSGSFHSPNPAAESTSIVDPWNIPPTPPQPQAGRPPAQGPVIQPVTIMQHQSTQQQSALNHPQNEDQGGNRAGPAGRGARRGSHGSAEEQWSGKSPQNRNYHQPRQIQAKQEYRRKTEPS